ncbi:hypothetical protein [Roseivivax sp. CAU 1761]
MERKPDTPKAPKPDRETRLKAALKANLGRRKAQAKAREAKPGDGDQAGKDR